MVIPFARYLVKTLWGHRSRTVLTLSSAAVAMFVFCFVRSVQDGLHQLTSDASAQRTLIVFQQNRYCPVSSRLPVDYARQIVEVPGVREAVPILMWTNNCRASLDAVVFKGLPDDALRRRGLTLVDGQWGQFDERGDAALVGRAVAKRRGLRPGATFAIGELSVYVAGVFASETPAEENAIYTRLEMLQYTRALNAAGMVTLHEVHLKPGANSEAVAAAIDAALQSGPVATSTRLQGAYQTSTLADLIDLVEFTHWLGYACLGLVLSIVATTTVMAVQDRIREHAVLRTIGVRPGGVFRLVLVESLALAVVGGAAGSAAAVAVLWWSQMAITSEAVTIALPASWLLAVQGVCVSVGLGVVAGVVPAVQAARRPIIAAMRSG